MAYILVDNFSQGLDTRKFSVTSPPGTLLELTNAVIDRGGQIEQRKRWQLLSTATTDSSNYYGVESAGGVVYGFSSVANTGIGDGQYPAIPVFQRIQHPTETLNAFADWVGNAALSKIASIVYSTQYSGNTVVIAKFVNGDVFPYYNGAVITDFVYGYAFSGMTVDMMFFLLSTQITAEGISDGYTAGYASATNILTVAGPVGKAFVTRIYKNGEDEGITETITTIAVPAVTGVKATGRFSILGGLATGTNQITSILVGGTGINLLSASVAWTTSNANTASLIAANIAARSGTSGWTATSLGTLLTIESTTAGDTYNSQWITITANNGVMTGTGGFRITGGTSNPGTNKLTSVLVNGVEQLNASVDWTTSNANTAALVAASINTKAAATFDCVAAVIGDFVQISLKVSTNASPVAMSVAVTVAGDITVDDTTALTTSIVKTSGGVTAVTGVAQTSILDLDVGTVPINTIATGDLFKVGFTAGSDTEIVFGAGRVAGLQPSVMLAFKTKLLAGIGRSLYGSGINTPTKWNADDTGSFVINMASEFLTNDQIWGLGSYQGKLAVLGRQTTQIWFMDPDPALNQQIQVLEGIGTMAPSSVASYGDTDLYFLSDSGVRSLRARDASNAASVNDLGTPIDDLITAKVLSIGEADRTGSTTFLNKCSGLIDPESGRYWLAMYDQIYVFSLFPSGKIAGWSKLEQYGPYQSTAQSYLFREIDIVVNSNQVLMFSRTTSATNFKQFFCYGYYRPTGQNLNDYYYGLNNTDAPDFLYYVTTATLPFLNAGKPAHRKQFTGLDSVVFRSWTVTGAFDTSATTAYEAIETVSGVSYDTGTDPMIATGTHCSLKYSFNNNITGVPAVAGPAKIGSIAIHYELSDAS